MIATLPSGSKRPLLRADVRRLTPFDADGLAGLDPGSAWIHSTWGAARLLEAEVAHAAFVDGRPVSVAVPFFVGAGYEDIGVVTEPAHRSRGLSTACAAAVVADIRDRGRVPSWTTSPDNPGSLAVAAQLGFVPARSEVLYAVHTPIPAGGA